MNWNKLQKMQLALDNAILQAKPKMTAEERFNKTLVALSVEVAEISNCSEHFKFWKDNKGKIDDKKFWEVYSNDYYDAKTRRTKYTFDQAHKLTLVEECSDALHFILSLANQNDYDIENMNVIANRTNETLEEVYLALQQSIVEFYDHEACKVSKTSLYGMVYSFKVYLELLGITTQELEQAYYEKNKVNYERLREGY